MLYKSKKQIHISCKLSKIFCFINLVQLNFLIAVIFQHGQLLFEKNQYSTILLQ